jgi:hypothetical protein
MFLTSPWPWRLTPSPFGRGRGEGQTALWQSGDNDTLPDAVLNTALGLACVEKQRRFKIL